MVRAVRGPFLAIFWLIVLAGAVQWQWAPALGDGRSEACFSRPTPAGVGIDMNWHPEPERTWWPLGVTCRWTNAATGAAPVVDGPGWGPTVVAGVALAGLGSVALSQAARTRSRRGPRERRARSADGTGRPPRPAR